MPLWDDPFDELLNALERAVPPPATDTQRPSVAAMQADYAHVCMFMSALLFSRDPDDLRRSKANPRIQRALGLGPAGEALLPHRVGAARLAVRILGLTAGVARRRPTWRRAAVGWTPCRRWPVPTCSPVTAATT